VTVSAPARGRVDADNVDDATNDGSDANEACEELNVNSNNGNDLTDDSEPPTPTICVYGSDGMAGPLGLDITPTNDDLADQSHCQCNVTTFILYMFTVRAVATDCNVFVRVFFLCTQDNSLTAALSSTKFCMILDNRTKPKEFQGRRSKVKVTGPDFRIIHHCEIGQESLCAR